MSKSMEIKSEDDYLLLSGIQHFQFCKRQWALIHIEQQWDENVRTIEGKLIHEKVDQPYLREKRKDVLVVRAMPICSHELRLTGVCDVVEFVGDPAGVQVHGSDRNTYCSCRDKRAAKTATAIFSVEQFVESVGLNPWVLLTDRTGKNRDPKAQGSESVVERSPTETAHSNKNCSKHF